MPEYCICELGLAIKVFCQITSASAYEGNWSAYEYVVSKRINLLSSERVEKLIVYIHGNICDISYC